MMSSEALGPVRRWRHDEIGTVLDLLGGSGVKQKTGIRVREAFHGATRFREEKVLACGAFGAPWRLTLNPWDFSGTYRLFVYGTLLTEDTFVRVLGQRFMTVGEFADPPRAGLCAARASLNDYMIAKPRGRYPVAIHSVGKSIHGMVVFRLTYRQLVVLDRYEGRHYARVPVTVETMHGPLHAETYLGTGYKPRRGDCPGPQPDVLG